MNQFRFWLPAILWAATIFVLSSTPPLLPQEQPPGFLIPTDKIAHFAAYGLLGGLVLFALRRAHHTPLPKAVALAILLASAYGATDEWHQRFIPHRQAALDDWGADVGGAVLVGMTWYFYESRRRHQTNR